MLRQTASKPPLAVWRPVRGIDLRPESADHDKRHPQTGRFIPNTPDGADHETKPLTLPWRHSSFPGGTVMPVLRGK